MGHLKFSITQTVIIFIWYQLKENYLLCEFKYSNSIMRNYTPTGTLFLITGLEHNLKNSTLLRNNVTD